MFLASDPRSSVVALSKRTENANRKSNLNRRLCDLLAMRICHSAEICRRAIQRPGPLLRLIQRILEVLQDLILLLGQGGIVLLHALKCRLPLSH